MLGEAFAFPTKGDEGLRTIVIGGILVLLFTLVVPVILVQGYLVRMARAGVRDDPEPPVFEEWVGLLVDGLKLLAVSVGYFLPALAVFAVARLALGADLGGGAGGPGGAVLLLAVVLATVATYLLPAGIANFAITGSVAGAFDAETVTDAARTPEYAVTVVLALAAGVVVSAVGGLLIIVLFGGFLLFYGQAVVYYLFGRGFAKGRGDRRHDAPSAL